MHINTLSKELMEESVCQLLNIDKDQLDELFDACYDKHQNNHPVFILDNQYDYFKEYVKEHLVMKIDEILFIHLSRRLDEDNNGYNLVDLLCQETSLSIFLKSYGITFKDDQGIKMYVHGSEIDLSNLDDYAYRYLQGRFRNGDYSITGFAFGDNLLSKELYNAVEGGPELFGYLYPFDEDDCLVDDFINNSILYQFDYLVPLKDIYFEGYDDLDNLDKQYHILIKALQRLYFYKYDKLFNDNDNVVIKMIDDKVLFEENLINKVKI